MRRTRSLNGPTDHVVVVGAGFAGLSAAMHLAGAGRRVTVLERAAGPGGRCDTTAASHPGKSGTSNAPSRRNSCRAGGARL